MQDHVSVGSTKHNFDFLKSAESLAESSCQQVAVAADCRQSAAFHAACGFARQRWELT